MLSAESGDDRARITGTQKAWYSRVSVMHWLSLVERATEQARLGDDSRSGAGTRFIVKWAGPPALSWRWKQVKLVAKDNDPGRISKLAHIRLLWETLQPRQVLLFAHELDIYLLPKTDYGTCMVLIDDFLAEQRVRFAMSQ